MKKAVKPLSIFFGTVIGLLIIDMVSKVLTDGKEFRVIPRVIRFESVHNEGIAFSFLSGAGIWLIVVTSILTVAAITAWWFVIMRQMRNKANEANLGKNIWFGNVAFAVFIAGAIGNLYDRIAYGHVRDFIRFEFWHTFPIFNFADICLNIGTVMLIVYLVFFTGNKNAA